MKQKKYKILACALSMVLAFVPNVSLAAGAEDVSMNEEGVFNEEDGVWEDEEDGFWEEDAFWDDMGCDLPAIDCCDAEACDFAGTGKSKQENAAQDDGGAGENIENAETAEPQEVNKIASIAGAKNGIFHKAVYASSRDDAIAGVYTPIKKAQLCVSAGAEDTVFLEVDEDTKIYCYGYYTEANGAKWYYVQYFQNGKSVVGFCNSEELK